MNKVLGFLQFSAFVSLTFIILLDYGEYNKSSNGMTLSSKIAKTKNNKITKKNSK